MPADDLPRESPTSSRITLDELQRIKKWHIAHKAEHPFKYQVLGAVLTLWLMCWVEWLPAFDGDGRFRIARWAWRCQRVFALAHRGACPTASQVRLDRQRWLA